MSTPLGDLELGSPESSGSESTYVAQLGRISGKLLQANLVRNGIDLSVRNEALDDDLLYLDVNNLRVGVNNDNPTVTLDVTGKAFISDSLTSVGTQATFGNVTFNSDGSVTSTTGPINIFTTGPSAQIEIGEARTPSFKIKDNYIESLGLNEDIQLSANASGFVDILSSARIDGDLDIDGRIAAYSDVRLDGQLIVGDSPVDVIVINPDFRQSIIPGANNTYTLGSADKRWGDTWIAGTLISNVANIDQILISEQMRISGNTIDTIRTNDDLTITYRPGQGIVLENLRIDRTPAGASLLHTLTHNNALGGNTVDYFGRSVDITDDYVIVGAPLEDSPTSSSGGAYIFDINNGNLLRSLADPNAFGTGTNDGFGDFNTVAIDGTRCIVGAPTEDDALGTDSGKAYIFDVTTGTLLHTLNNPNVSANDKFGVSVDISGNFCIVGAPGGTLTDGYAYIFDVTTGSLVFTLTNPDAGTNLGDFDNYGFDVAISQSYAIVGAPGEDDVVKRDNGKAYIFDVGTGTLLYTINNPDPLPTSPTSGDDFGYSVDICESYAIVGAPDESGNELTVAAQQNGKAYIFSTSTGSLLHQLDWPDGPSNFGRFAESVGISESFAIVGCRNYDSVSPVYLDAGRAYIFSPATGQLLQTIDNANASGTPANDRFSAAVAVSESHVLIGAWAEASSAGRAYLYEFGPTTDTITNLSTTEPLTFVSTGNGYLKIADTNAMRIPFGTTAERPSAEVGETRWNSDLGYVECFDGSVYLIATGGGALVTPRVMEELGHVYTLILG